MKFLSSFYCLSLAFVLAAAEPEKTVAPDPTEANIARLSARILERSHYLQHPLDDEMSSRFFDRYLETLDGLHLHFFTSDVQEFEKYRKQLDDLTLKKGKTLYLHPGGKLSFDPPPEADAAFDEYISDPAHPVPFTARITTGMPKEYMVEDQRFAATRPDV